MATKITSNSFSDLYKLDLYNFFMKTETIHKRIELLLNQKNGGNQSEMARSIGVTPQAIQQWINGETSPRGKNLEKAAFFLGVSPAHLKFGEPSTQNISPADIGTRRIPLISRVQAGMWKEICDNFEPGDAEEWLLTDLELSRHSFALTIDGDSMEPDFKAGDRVIIDPEIAPRPGDFVVAKNGDKEATFKKYRSRGVDVTGQEIIELIPLNPDYPSLNSATSPIVIVGVMVEHRRYRKR